MADKQREIDWAGATVGADATVLPLTGDASKAWTERFEGVAELLGRAGNAGWGQVSVSKKAIEVAGLHPGAEDDLRHFLESVVVQVNFELAPEPDAQASEPQDPQAAQDEQMADKLRSFSGGDEPQG